MKTLLHVTTVPQTLEFLAGQAAFLREQGFEVVVISSPGSDLDRFCERERVAGYAVEMTRQVTPLRDLRVIFQLWKTLRRVRPQIVHAHTPKAGLLAMIAARLYRAPVRIFHLHGLPHSTAAGMRRHVLKWSTRVACALSHRVLCVSFSIRDAAIAERLAPPKKIFVPANGSIRGVDAAGVFNPAALAADTRERVRARFGIPADARVMGFVGRVVADKGIRELAAAWRTLRERFADAHWLIVGAEESHDPLPAGVAAGLRHDPRVHLAGWSRELPELYSAMDFVVLPSYREGFPVVPLEAAAMGLPVIATRIAGSIEAVEHGRTGTLIEPRNVEQIVQSAAAYFSHRALCRAQGEAGRNRVLERFRPVDIWRATERHYSELLQARVSRKSFPRLRRARLLKRLIDLSGALLGLVLLSPLLAAIAVSILIAMGRPVLFRQIRPGWNEQPFEILKFRTMAAGGGADERRLTRLGKFLRELSLDELPQLWNVLHGEMSLVGPRPLLLEYLPRYSETQRRRHRVKPGITGWAQVHGRNEVAWQNRFALDVWYADHWSLALDFKILWRTLGQVFARKGISEPGAATMSPFGGQS